MIKLSDAHKDSIRALTTASRSLPWYASWLFPTPLKAALEAHQETTDEIKSAWNIGQIFVKHTWFFQLWFLSCLRIFSQSDFTKACTLSLLAGETQNYHPIFDGRTDPEEAARQKEKRKQEDVLSEFPEPEAQKYYLSVAEHPNVQSIRMGFIALYYENLLVCDAGEANFGAIVVDQEYVPGAIARCLIALRDAGLLHGDNAQTNREALKSASILGLPHLGGIVNALRTLKQAGLFSGTTADSRAIAQANFNAVIQHPTNPEAVADSLVRLHNAGLLTQEEGQEIRDILSRHKSPEDVTSAILCLQEPEDSTFKVYAQRKQLTFFQHLPNQGHAPIEQKETAQNSAQALVQ